MTETPHTLTFNQAASSYFELTNTVAATWAQNALSDWPSLRPTGVAREEGVVADPDDTAAIGIGGAAYEAWRSNIG